MESIDEATMVYIAVLLLLMIFTVLGNSTVIYILMTRKQFRVVGNFYFVSLSVSDIFIGVFVVSSVIISVLKPETPMAWCFASPYLEMVAFCGGIFSLVTISFDRYRAVLQAATYAPEIKKAVVHICCIWLGAVVYSTRLFLQFEVKKYIIGDDDTERNTSGNVSSDSDNDNENEFCNFLNEEDTSDIIWRLIDFLLLFIIPMTTMTYLYHKIIRRLWSTTVESTASIQRKRKVVKMLVANGTVFFLCWVPFYLQDIISDSIEYFNSLKDDDDDDDDDDNNSVIRGIRLFLVFVTLLHSVLNPILFFIANSKFREEISSITLKITCRNKKTSVAPCEVSVTATESQNKKTEIIPSSSVE